MDYFTFVAAIFAAVAWPIAVALIAIVFRKPLIELIARITTISHNQTRIDMAPLEESSAAAEIAGSLTIDDSQSDSRADSTIASAPRAAIIEGWIRVESAAWEALARKRITPERRSRSQMLHMLRDQKLLDPALLRLVRDLMMTRNRAAHESDLDISPEAARRYVDIADQVVATLNPRKG